MKRKVIKIAIAIVAFWLLSISFLPANPGLAAGTSDRVGLQNISGAPGAQAEISKVLEVLESKMEDQKLLETAKQKLLTLDRNHTRLLSSLCDVIATDGQTAGSDVAFLLVTILIVLS
jgi:hypothetical protein